MNDSSTVPRKPLRILFMHGLESGPGGSKDRYLRQHFEEVCTPDMKMSLFRLTRSNSVLRNALRRPLFLGWTTAAAVTLPFAVVTYAPVALPEWAAVFGGVLVTIRKRLARQALAASLNRSIAIQAAAIREFHPDIVIGSSWGSLVALMCVSRGVYSGPQLLLAPPAKLVLDRLGDTDGSRWETLCRSISPEIARGTLVVHGDEDTTVPVDDSRLLAAATGIELRVIPGDHRLNTALIDSAEGQGTSDRLKELVSEVAARNCHSLDLP